MTIFSGCDCCRSCGPPQLSNMPGSIEVDIENTSARQASLTVTFQSGAAGNKRDDLVYTATIPSVGGTYSLARISGTQNYEYKSDHFSLSLEFAAHNTSLGGFVVATMMGSIGMANNYRGVDCEDTFFDMLLFRRCDYPTPGVITYPQPSFVSRLDGASIANGPFPTRPCRLAIAEGESLVRWPSQIGAVSFLEACRLPVRAQLSTVGSADAPSAPVGVTLFDDVGSITGTFDSIAASYQDFSFGRRHRFAIGISIGFLVRSARLIYGSDSVEFLNENSATGCTVTA